MQAVGVFTRFAFAIIATYLTITILWGTGQAACVENSQCGTEGFCLKDSCDSPGTCSPRPEICTQQYRPVCGCDGKTYSNRCIAHSHGMNIAHEGACMQNQFKISLDLEVDGHLVRAAWNATFDVTEYTLYFAPYPDLAPIGMLSLGSAKEISATLPTGSAYYIAIGATAPDGSFVHSDVDWFRIVPIWRPVPETSWQWQLTGTLDTSINATMFDIDLFNTPKETIQVLHQRKKVVICYFSAGTYEPWRPDAHLFPEYVIGEPLEDWPDERWLDIRAIQELAPIMEARLDMAVEKGCDGVEPDNVDGYANNTGFPLTYDQQISYNTWLSKEAHKRGLSIGLKNDLDQIQDLEPYFDWALNEECFSYDECQKLLPFVQENKAVFGVEYELDTGEFCHRANEMGFSFLKKKFDLDAWYISCEEIE